MENQEVSCDVDDDELSLNHIVDEEDFRSCCGDDEQMFFKGVSITERGDSSSGHSGIGVVLERSGEDFELIQVQKKLDFYAQDSVANYLALLDGLTVALENNLHSVVAITNEEKLETPILVALRERLAPLCDLHQALTLARVAVEFCYCCGGEYREGQQSCTCAFWDDEEEEDQEDTIQELEQWPWDTFNSMPSVMDRLLRARKVSASSDPTVLSWWFVSVISDDYYEEYINSQ
ncbi:hypothetical protein DY000_02026928 [Brassica cretica]|uniref:RNase H type-1 domain-containing protein n=1 Tax=Brassica cretica TaxID=69181 RepID=A0ABQ7E4R8_BRACR|nr:hypothetical protein DY000_02026928 [Brassica cretica]